MLKLGLISGLALSVTGCDDVEPMEVVDGLAEDAALRSSIISGGGGWGCRTCDFGNSPHCGTNNDIGVVASGAEATRPLSKLAGIEDGAGVRHPVIVDHDEFVAQTPAGPVQGAGLSGWTLVFSNGMYEFTAEITAFAYHPDWVNEDPIPTYGLAYEDLSLPEPEMVNVCPGFIPDETSVVLITDETYDETTKTVNPNETGWTTLACQGHALAKMKFAGYDPNDQYGSTPEQRQSTLKMFTADYCGTGQSFTTFGQKLQWLDSLWHFTDQDYQELGVLEAKWNDGGATCLDDPRYGTRADVEAVCPSIPTCDQDPDIGGDDWVTFIP